MRPYSNKWQWNFKSRPHHLIDGLMPAAKELKGEVHDAFLVRAGMMRRALRAKAVVLTLLYIGVAATSLAWLAQFVSGVDAVVDWVRAVAQALSGISLLLFGILLLVQRRVAQLEADLVVLCISNR